MEEKDTPTFSYISALLTFFSGKNIMGLVHLQVKETILPQKYFSHSPHLPAA